MALKRVLVALGGSRYMDSAMAEAVQIARRNRAEIIGLAVMDETLVDPAQAAPIGGGASAADLRDDRRRRIEEAIDDAIGRFERVLADSGLPGRAERTDGDAQEVLVEAMKLADLSIIGIRHAFDYGTVDHADDFIARVATASNRPIIAMPEGARPVSKVLVAYDGSMASANALRSFTTLRAFDPSLIRLVYCRDDESDPDAILAEGRGYLELHGYTVETAVLEDPPSTAILAEATDIEADLVVMGAVGRRGLSRLPAGDTAASLLETSSVPLFLRR
ncbi:MAG: hypothetical protein CMJ34_07395 [Phycisphaerae bacterium]|nr:hypothetical protein [Phycisphaerae bacterium]